MNTKDIGLSDIDLKFLVEHTHFDKSEIQQHFTQFETYLRESESPDPEAILKEDFLQLFHMMGVTNSFVADLLFKAFDTKHDESIDFREFMIGLSILTRGTKEEKMRFAFRIYDMNGDGYVTKQDLYHILSQVTQMFGEHVVSQAESLTNSTIQNLMSNSKEQQSGNRISQIVNKIVKNMTQSDNADQISFQQYKKMNENVNFS